MFAYGNRCAVISGLEPILPARLCSLLSEITMRDRATAERDFRHFVRAVAELGQVEVAQDPLPARFVELEPILPILEIETIFASAPLLSALRNHDA